jgi:hypothetical protein
MVHSYSEVNVRRKHMTNTVKLRQIRLTLRLRELYMTLAMCLTCGAKVNLSFRRMFNDLMQMPGASTGSLHRSQRSAIFWSLLVFDLSSRQPAHEER